MSCAEFVRAAATAGTLVVDAAVVDAAVVDVRTASGGGEREGRVAVGARAVMRTWPRHNARRGLLGGVKVARRLRERGSRIGAPMHNGQTMLVVVIAADHAATPDSGLCALGPSGRLQAASRASGHVEVGVRVVHSSAAGAGRTIGTIE